MDSNDFDRKFRRLYRELRRCAAYQLRRDRKASLSATGLVHEAWLRMRQTPELAGTSTGDFKSIAARAMRNILVDAARKRGAARRGGPLRFSVTLNEELAGSSCTLELLLELDAALHKLHARDPYLESIAVARHFGECTVAEIAESNGVSSSKIERDLRTATAFLKRELSEPVAAPTRNV